PACGNAYARIILTPMDGTLREWNDSSSLGPEPENASAPALTSQWGNVGPIQTEEIACRAKFRQRVPLLECGIDVHKCLASICPVGFRSVPDHCDCHTK